MTLNTYSGRKWNNWLNIKEKVEHLNYNASVYDQLASHMACGVVRMLVWYAICIYENLDTSYIPSVAQSRYGDLIALSWLEEGTIGSHLTRYLLKQSKG